MTRFARDEKREQRITYEIVVDAYGPEEQAMGWYSYLEDTLHFPFRARCIAERAISPLRSGEKVEIVDMAPDEECEHGMFVMATWRQRTFAIPLDQIEGIGVDEETEQAIGDWQYWVGAGYTL
jgi:hypothetical protein